MSMSTHAVGFRPPDETWNRMKCVWETCEQAGVAIPEEVLAFFDHEDPANKPGMEVDIKEAAVQWSDDDTWGYEIDTTKLPKDVTIIRVFNSC